MGNEPAKQKQFKPIKMDKMKIEITAQKTLLYVQLQRDRRNGEIKQKEKALLEMLKRPERNKDDEVMKAQAIINDIKFVKACNIVIRYCDIIKDKSINIVASQGDPTKIEELLPYIESVIWSAKPLNLSSIQEFQGLMAAYFGPSILDSVANSYRVDNELKECFKSLIPDPYEVNDYFIKFLDKNSIDIAKFNEVGHEVSRDLKRPQFINPYAQQQPQFGQGGPGFGQNPSMPPGPGGPQYPGYPPYGGGFPGGGPGYNPYQQPGGIQVQGFDQSAMSANSIPYSIPGGQNPYQQQQGGGYGFQQVPQQPVTVNIQFDSNPFQNGGAQNTNKQFGYGQSSNTPLEPAKPTGFGGYPNLPTAPNQTPGQAPPGIKPSDDYDELEARINRLKNGGL